MANHKRHRSKRARAGCKLCKPHKQPGQGLDALAPRVKKAIQPDEWKRQEPERQDDVEDPRWARGEASDGSPQA